MTDTHNPVVLVGCDGSYASQVAVQAATRSAGQLGAGVFLLVVAAPADTSLAGRAQAEAEANAHGRAVLRRAVDTARQTDPRVRVETMVVRDAQEPGLADVLPRTVRLVVGGHGSGGQAAFSLGSTSEALARRAGRPVLVPRQGRVGARSGRRPEPRPVHEPPKVRVGYRPGIDPTGLLVLAAQEALGRDLSLRVMTCLPHGGDVERVQRDVWEDVRAIAACGDVPCEVEVLVDTPDAALMSECGPGDLLVVGTRGGGTLAGLIRGSVARSLLDHAPCDVLVAPLGTTVAIARPVHLGQEWAGVRVGGERATVPPGAGDGGVS